jgi:hypothetical protein
MLALPFALLATAAAVKTAAVAAADPLEISVYLNPN